MRSAYNEAGLYNLAVNKETKRWIKEGFISEDQFKIIKEQYQADFYHPNFIIRILLFVATLFGLAGVTGLFALMVAAGGETFISIACIIYGIASFVILEKAFIGNSKHYKSGVTEALLYHACGFTLGGLGGLTDFNSHLLLFASVLLLAFSAYRYLDLLSTLAALAAFGAFLFFEFYSIGGLMQQIIPFVFILTFTPIYFLTKKLKNNIHLKIWRNNLLIIEVVSLLLIYLAGNYLVVRELSIELMDLYLEPGQDIPFAFIFYAFTIAFPIAYLYFGIVKKDIVLLRTSLLVIALSVFTFKYYYGFGHPEITLTLAGAVLLLITLILFNYLKVMRNGFTRENVLSEKWSSLNAEAFVISQTMGGNQVQTGDTFKGGGGEFGGGGASGDF